MMETSKPNWEQQTIEKIALEGLREQKRSRRWRIFFKILFFIFFAIFIFSIATQSSRHHTVDSMGRSVNSISGEHIALIRLEGLIAGSEFANAEELNATLRQAMSDPKVKGILIRADSPGGSPVQSSLVYKTIQSLKKMYPKPILTVVTDTCASGCYYIVSATDEIYADESSIIGSIGVISQSVGYGEAAKKLGLVPRTFTAGKNKDFLNPARPLRADEVDYLKQILDKLHQNFINAVKQGRGSKLANSADLFSGLFWVGKDAQKLGLIDGIATPHQVAQKIGDYPIYDYDSGDSMMAVLKKLGVEAKQSMSKGISEAILPSSNLQLK